MTRGPAVIGAEVEDRGRTRETGVTDLRAAVAVRWDVHVWTAPCLLGTKVDGEQAFPAHGADRRGGALTDEG